MVKAYNHSPFSAVFAASFIAGFAFMMLHFA
jgi:hypothetical protein